MSTGTNKERLEQNNTKIDSLINLVKSKGSIPSKLPQVIDKSITELTAEDFGDITVIGNSVFVNCSELKTADLPDSITMIGNSAFSDCRKLELTKLPNELLTIGDNVFFEGNNNIISEFPSKLTSIGQQAFYRNTKMQSAIFPETITSIGYGAFQNCFDIKTVIFKGQSTNILARTFQNCNVEIYDFSNCITWPTLANVNALGHASGCVIRVPEALYDTAITATNWSALTDVVWEKVGGEELITFTIITDGTSYQARQNMTWADWVESEYCPDKTKWRILYNDAWGETFVIYDNFTVALNVEGLNFVYAEDLIEANGTYKTVAD